MADGVISPQQGRRPCPGDGRAIRRTGTPNSLLYATSSNTTPQTAPVTSVISWGPRSSFPRNARLSSNFKRYRKFVDSPLEGAVSSEPVSGVRFPGYWEKIQGISAESQQERF